MNELLKSEWKRIIHSVPFFISLLLAYILILISAGQQFFWYLDGFDVEVSVFSRWIGVSKNTYGAVGFFKLIPVISAVAGSYVCANQIKKDKINRNSSYGIKYYIAKYIVSFFSGGIVFSSAVLFHFMLLSMFMKAYKVYPENLDTAIDQFRFCSKIFYTKPYLFMVLWLGITFLWGGVMAIVGLTSCVYLPNWIVSILSPFLLFTVEGILGEIVMQKELFFAGRNILGLSWENMLYAGTMESTPTMFILANIIFIIGLSTLLYCLRVKKFSLMLTVLSKRRKIIEGKIIRSNYDHIFFDCMAFQILLSEWDTMCI